MRKNKGTLEEFYFIMPLIAFAILVIGMIILFK